VTQIKDDAFKKNFSHLKKKACNSYLSDVEGGEISPNNIVDMEGKAKRHHSALTS
jgi:hypothetical protein